MGSKRPFPESLPSLFGKTRQALLALLYTRPDEELLQEQLIQHAGLGRGSVQRELEFLARAGIARRTVHGRQVYFQANPACPIFPELRSLVVKTSGVADVLRAAFAPLASRIRVAFVYGSVARGEERRASDVDVMVVGEATFSEVVDALASAQDALGREVNPTVYPPDEFRAKINAKHHFLVTIIKGDKLFLIGDQRELGRLAKK
jgi:predicted nucleotidyltransferase